MALANFKRVIWLVMDGVGAGELPDARAYGDAGSNTLGNLARAFRQQAGRTLRLPHLEALGLGAITPMEGVATHLAPAQQAERLGRSGVSFWGRAAERSEGKDTTSGHWEMAGLVVDRAFATYPDGFPTEVIARWVAENGLPGVLCNQAMSGTTVLERFGDEHVRSLKPILYTSADSVWQVAAHEQAFGLERLYSICESARRICDELGIGRVIARPFVGDPARGEPYQRTYHRKDYAQPPSGPTLLDRLVQAETPVHGIGKIGSIYAYRGITDNVDTEGNVDGMRTVRRLMHSAPSGLLFCNLIDFDMLYGHRRDVLGFGRALEEFDGELATLIGELGPQDLLVLDADHGNDPTYRGTDHTREYVPVLGFAPGAASQPAIRLGDLDSFGDIGISIGHALLGAERASGALRGLHGESFAGRLAP